MKRKLPAVIVVALLVAMGVGVFLWKSSVPPEPPKDAIPHGGRLFKLYLEDIPWDEARAKCERLGGRLVIVQDQATHAFLGGLTKGKLFWIGATDEHQEGDWRWVDGSEVTFDGWHDKQPGNLGGKEHYLLIGALGKWNDVGLEGPGGARRMQGFICEWPAPEETQTKSP